MPNRALPSVWRVVVVALTVLALVEVGVRAREDRLDRPREWYTNPAQSRIDAANLIRDEGIRSDILFVGTSMTRMDIRVEVIEDRLVSVEQAHNAALPAAQTPVVGRWLLEAMIPRLRPSRVVWGVSSLDFNGNRLEPTIDWYNSARASRPGWVGQVDRGLGDLMALSHHRVALRDPAWLGALFGLGERAEEEPGREVNPDRLLAPGNNRTESIEELDKEFERIRTEVVNDFSVGEREAGAFRSTIVELQRMGIEVVVILMPVPDAYVAAHPDGEEDFAEFQEFVITEVEGLGVPYFDYSHFFDDDSFADVTHLLREPSMRFTELLSADLAGLGW